MADSSAPAAECSMMRIHAVEAPMPPSRRLFHVYQRSCLPCAKAKRACDHGSPCARCIQLGAPELCVVAEDRRRSAAQLRGTAPEEDGQVNFSENVDAAGVSSSESSSTTLDAASPADSEAGVSYATSTTRKRAYLNTSMDSTEPMDDELELLTALRRAAAHPPRSPYLSLHERIATAIARAYKEDKHIFSSIPAVPLAVPLERLKAYANSEGRVDATRLRGPLEEEGTIPSGSTLGSGQLLVPGGPAAVAHMSTLLLDGYGTSPLPTLRVFFATPRSYDIHCREPLQPALAYANLAFMRCVGPIRFIPAHMQPSGDEPPHPELFGNAIRLAAAMGIIAPAAACFGHIPKLTQENIRDWSAAQIMEAFRLGVLLRQPPATSMQRAAVGDRFRKDFFRTIAEALITGRITNRIVTRQALSVAMQTPGGEVVHPPFTPEVLRHFPFLAEVLAANPVAHEMFFGLRFAVNGYVDIEAVSQLFFSADGVLTSAMEVCTKWRMHPPTPSPSAVLSSDHRPGDVSRSEAGPAL